MALIKCPECGRENVSDSAEMCPSCGFGIKAHYEKIKIEEERREQAKRLEESKKKAEIEEKKRQEERIKNVPRLERPQLFAPIITLIFGSLCILLAIADLNASEWEVERSISDGKGDPHFQGVLFLFMGIIIICVGIYLFVNRMKRYNLSKTNFEEYQKLVIKEEDAMREIQQRQLEQKIANAIKCPNCGSINTKKISTSSRAASVAMVGVASSKIGKQFECKKCGYKW